jgi:hypothetical protein
MMVPDMPDRAVLVVLCGAVLAVALSIEVGTASPQKPVAPIDVCTLLPREDVSKMLGRSFPRARPEKRLDGPMECRYSGGPQGTVTVMIGGGIAKARWDESMKVLRDSGASLEPVPGVGDGAYFWNTRLYAHVGTHEVTISTSPTPGVPPAKSREDALALANVIVAKLKG